MLYGAMNFPVKPVIEELEEISRLGFDYLELAMDPPQAHCGIIRQEREDILRALDRCNMKIICHLPTFVFTADLTDSLREASLNEVIASLDVASDLRPLKVVLHPSYFMGLSIFVMEKARQYAMTSLEAILEKAGELGLCICIENMFPKTNSLSDPEDFSKILERFPTLKLTLDTGHAHIDGKGRNRALDFIEMFPDRIGHIHANDNFGREDIHLPIGAGTIDFRTIARALREIKYNETVTLEVFSLDRDYLKISRDKLASIMSGKA
jgi:sugar phosphate isomerase/epimerase